MPASPFIALNKTPGLEYPLCGGSVIDTWSAVDEFQCIVRGFTLQEILPILWNCKTLRADISFSFQTKDGGTSIISGSYSHNETSIGAGETVAPEPRQRIAYDGSFPFSVSIYEDTHTLIFNVIGILNQGDEWALVCNVESECTQYHDDQDGIDYTDTMPIIVVAPDIPNIISGFTLLSSLNASIFGKSVTLKIYGTNNLYTFTSWSASVSVYVAESWEY